MSAHFDIEKDDTRFNRLSVRVVTIFALFLCIYASFATYNILKDNPVYMRDWRGITVIGIVIVILLLYLCAALLSFKIDWPLPLRYSISIWGSIYVAVIGISLIDASFSWYFYVLFASGFALFGGGRLLLAVGIMTVTMFAFQGLLIWPLNGAALATIVGQSMAILSMTGFNLVFQYMIGERFKRNHLFKQLAQANHELEEAHRQLEQSVAQEQELAVLRERTRLAREMHDTIGHALVLISVKLEAAQRLRERDPERCDRELESTKSVARETMTALRASIANLRSPALEHEDINRALSHSARALAQRTGLHVTYTLQADSEHLPASIEETLWKASQEAFTNIEKHAHASNVHICISRQNEKLLMRISDDGVGLPETLCQGQQDSRLLESSLGDHYGLRGMLERVEALDGRLTLRSGQEQGTILEIELPLASSSNP